MVDHAADERGVDSYQMSKDVVQDLEEREMTMPEDSAPSFDAKFI